MSAGEFKARALYDFVAEGSNELSFKTNDVLTITSNSGGNGWWYAKNSSGQVGVIPENYVQALADPPEPNEPPPSFSTFSNNYPNLDAFNSNGNSARTAYHQPPSYEQHSSMYPQTNYMNTNSWQAQDTTPWQSSAPPVNLLDFPLENSTLPLTTKNDDNYITVGDISPLVESVPFVSSNLPLENSSPHDQSGNWYDFLPQTPAPVPDNTVQTSFSFNFVSQSTPNPFTSNVDLFGNPIQPITSSVDVQTSPQSISTITSDSTNGQWSSSPIKTESSMLTLENHANTVKKSKKSSFVNIFSKKSKSNKIKNSNDDEVAVRQSSKRDTDSDDSFSDSEYPTPSSAQITNTNPLPGTSLVTNQARTSIATPEPTKGPPRARFFDKHGLDSYLLNGSKTKSDEHVEITYDERQGGVCWSPNPGIPPFTCKVEDPSKGTKLGGLKAFMEYKIQPQVPGCRLVGRRYKQFDWLHEQLVNKFRFVCIPPLPGKQIAGRFEQEFIEERRRQLELWLNRICSHPVLCASFAVQHFITCDSSDKNRKDWKTGKRRVEKDESREASWLQCVEVIQSGLADHQIISQIDTFAQQQPNLESQMKNLSQGLAKYIERHTEVYEKDLQRISDVFSKVHLAVQVDTTTPGNKDLSASIHKISGSYSGVAELYKTKASEGLRDFNERVQEYIGLLACFPSILNIQRSASDFMKTIQQRGVTDFSTAVHRNYVLNHVVLAEINFFQREKVDDFSNYFKTLVDEQIQFYEQITSELRSASATFK